MDPDHSLISGRNGPEESATWTYHPMCTVYHVASAAGRDSVYASCCTGICHVDSIKKYLQLGDYESAMGEMTLDLVSLTGAGETQCQSSQEEFRG